MTKAEYRQEQRVKPMGVDGIDQCREIMKRGQYAKVNEVMVDLFSASAIVKVYDNLNATNQGKLIEQPVAVVADLAFAVIDEARA